MRYRTVVAGLGARGKVHIKGMLENPERFEIVGLYDPDENAVKKVRDMFGLSCAFSSAEEMMERAKPQVLAFVTHPDHRTDYVELGVKHKVMGISFEKPMAVSLAQANEIADLCANNNIKAVVSHQQKYLKQMQLMRSHIASGVIGKPVLLRISTAAWASQLGTHFIDYALWANGGVRADWVVGHVNGRAKLSDNHPSPDFLFGEAHMRNGVMLMMEIGYLKTLTMPADAFWVDNRLTVFGERGYVWAETDGKCCVFSPETGREPVVTEYPNWNIQEKEIQTPYYKEFADWLDDDAKIHPSNVEISRHGYEIMEGAFLSALRNKRVDLPIRYGGGEDAIAEMEKTLPEQEYGPDMAGLRFFTLKSGSHKTDIKP